MYRVLSYVTLEGKDVYREWHRKLRDTRARIAADRRIIRIEAGNLGDHKFCRDGVWELRIDYGPGYRIYYALLESQVVLLLCAGDKSSQPADIERAAMHLRQFQEEQS